MSLAPDRPLASVTMLTKNPGLRFQATLEAIFGQKCAAPFEVVMVDSGSTDGTLELARQYPIRLHTIAPADFNFGRTRDYVFSLAKGDFIVAISQDAVPAGPSWLEHLLRPFAEDDVALVQGVETLPEDGDVFYWEKVGFFYFTRECRRWREKHGGVGVSFVNCAIRRSAWEENRLSDIEMMEDKVFQAMLDARGRRICKEPAAAVFHAHAYSLASLARRCANEGLGWKIAGQDYSALDAARDVFKPRMWQLTISGIVRGQITTPSEVMFPLVRPCSVFFGHRVLDRYIS